jgi:2,3-bisphosphoglycerate-independent phosphoglycerate mutase
MPKEKAEALETIDRIFIKGLIKDIKEDYSLIFASDHYTFSDSGGHGGDPAPFMLYKNDTQYSFNRGAFSEKSCLSEKNTLSPLKLLQKL